MKVLVGKARKEMRHELHLADVAAKAAAAEEASKAATTEKPPATVGNGPPGRKRETTFSMYRFWCSLMEPSGR